VKVVSIVGARPQFIKAAPMSRALRAAGHHEYLVHTGQHYDARMSKVFFDELGIPPPDINLEVGSASHGRQTAQMLERIEEVLLAQTPDAMVVFGDTNSTVAGALAAAKLHISIAHVEAGLRSFNRRMPEELNRIVTDHLSAWLWAPSRTAVDNLRNEGVSRGVTEVGDIMADALLFAKQSASKSKVREQLGVADGKYLVATVHRAESTVPATLVRIVTAFARVEEPIILPLHPRTRAALAEAGCALPANVRLVEPLGHLDMIALLAGARLLLTDSGGLQKEAYWLGVPCITLREETEWVETVTAGWNSVAGYDVDRIIAGVRTLEPPTARPVLYGDGCTAERCARLLGEAP
jgi:UDP-N-acetylglucosamine 2-epimerase